MSIPAIVEKLQHNLRFEVAHFKAAIFPGFSEQEKTVLRGYKDIHAGEIGVIIANGPSLNSVDFGKLHQFPTFGMNRINLLYDRFDFRPTYYCLEDHLVAEDNAEEISNLLGSTMFIPKDLSYCIRNPHAQYVNMIRRYPNAKVTSLFSTDLSQSAYWGGTVTYFAMQIAYYMGFQTIYLVGLDHNYARPDHVVGTQTYTSHGDDVNHFDPSYFGKGKRWHDPRVDRMEASYQVAKQAFEAVGRTIINATPQSKLDVFPKMDFADVPVS